MVGLPFWSWSFPALQAARNLLVILIACGTSALFLIITYPHVEEARFDRLLRDARRRATFADHGQRHRRRLRTRLWARLRTRLAQAGYGDRWRPGHLVVASLFCSLLGGAASWALLP